VQKGGGPLTKGVPAGWHRHVRRRCPPQRELGHHKSVAVRARGPHTAAQGTFGPTAAALPGHAAHHDQLRRPLAPSAHAHQPAVRCRRLLEGIACCLLLPEWAPR
jgi:hypothetical protein